MTINEFIKALAKVRARRGIRPRKPGGMLRFIRTRGRCLCPITAVCLVATGKFFEPRKFYLAAKEINLTHEASARIVRAADTAYSTRLRRRLERAMFGAVAMLVFCYYVANTLVCLA